LKHIFDNAFMPETSDNAVASLAKMIYINPSLIPLNVVLPVIFKVVPLKGDFEEEKAIVKMILFLFDTNLSALNGLEDASIGLLIDGLMNIKKYKLPEDIANASVVVLKKLMEDEAGRKLIEGHAGKLSQNELVQLDALLK